MKDVELDKVIQLDHEATAALCSGDPEPKKRLYSHSDCVTLANPLGPPARGWQHVAATLETAAGMLRDAEPTTYERVSECETTDMAYVIELERTSAKVGRVEEPSTVALRATTIFRREEDGWKIVHRHADPITTPRSIQSVVSR